MSAVAPSRRARAPHAPRRRPAPGRARAARQETVSVATAPAPAADRETGARADDHEALRLWLRLLTCTTLVERAIRARLHARFGVTLARFDLLAQLERHPAGLRMSELSRRLMVTGGNVTGLTDQLVAEGLVERRAVPGDRRAFAVALTPAGRRAFAQMAAAHERWVIELFAPMKPAGRRQLYALLGALKSGLRPPPQEKPA